MIRPIMNRDSQFFWDGTAAEELRVQKCNACGELRFPPGPACPDCGALDRGWVAAKLATARITSHEFSTPSPRPTAPNTAYSPSPIGISTTNATTAITAAATADRRKVARVTGGVYAGVPVTTTISPHSRTSTYHTRLTITTHEYLLNTL